MKPNTHQQPQQSFQQQNQPINQKSLSISNPILSNSSNISMKNFGIDPPAARLNKSGYSIFSAKDNQLLKKRDVFISSLQQLLKSDRDYFIFFYDIGSSSGQQFKDESKSNNSTNKGIQKSILDTLNLVYKESSQIIGESHAQFANSKSKAFTNSRFVSVYGYSDNLKPVANLKDRKIAVEIGNLGISNGISSASTSLQSLVDEILTEEKKILSEAATAKYDSGRFRVFITIGTSGDDAALNDNTKVQNFVSKLGSLRDRLGENLHIKLEHYVSASNNIKVHTTLKNLIYFESAKVFNFSSELQDDYRKNDLFLKTLYKIDFQLKEYLAEIASDNSFAKLMKDIDNGLLSLTDILGNALNEKQSAFLALKTIKDDIDNIRMAQSFSKDQTNQTPIVDLLKVTEKARISLIGASTKKKADNFLKNLESEILKRIDSYSSKKNESVNAVKTLYKDESLLVSSPYGEMIGKFEEYIDCLDKLIEYLNGVYSFFKAVEVDLIDYGLELRANVNNFVKENRDLVNQNVMIYYYSYKSQLLFSILECSQK